METDERLALIRRGNELYNRGDFKNALKIFLVTGYKDGIGRVADHLYYDENDQIGAIKLYKRAGYKHRLEEFAEKAAWAIRLWLEEDKIAPATENEEPVVVAEEGLSPKVWTPKSLTRGDIMEAQIQSGDIDEAFKNEDEK